MMRKLKLDELGRLSPSEYSKVIKIPVVVILDNIRSGANVGAFFRTADAFRIDRIILTGITPAPPHREILKTAIGASLSVEWEYVEEVTEAIRTFQRTHEVIGVEQTDVSIPVRRYVVDPKKKYALVFGNEVDGLSVSAIEMLHQCVEIMQYGTKHSLNVAVCGGIVIWHFAGPFLDRL